MSFKLIALIMFIFNNNPPPLNILLHNSYCRSRGDYTFLFDRFLIMFPLNSLITSYLQNIIHIINEIFVFVVRSELFFRTTNYANSIKLKLYN